MFKITHFITTLLGGILFAVAALCGLFILIPLLILFFCVYRFFWLFSSAAFRQRTEQKFKRRKEKLQQRGLKLRAKFSTRIDQNNIQELIALAKQEMILRKPHLDSAKIKEVQYILNRCQIESDFNKVLIINNTIMQTDVEVLNETMDKLLVELSSFSE